jgi:hypothetical protein
MALYRVGLEGHYRSGKLYSPGDTIQLLDGECPSRTFIPLDDKAKAAFKKHLPHVKWELNRWEREAPREASPATMAEAQRSGTHLPDDR